MQAWTERCLQARERAACRRRASSPVCRLPPRRAHSASLLVPTTALGRAAALLLLPLPPRRFQAHPPRTSPRDIHGAPPPTCSALGGGASERRRGGRAQRRGAGSPRGGCGWGPPAPAARCVEGGGARGGARGAGNNTRGAGGRNMCPRGAGRHHSSGAYRSGSSLARSQLPKGDGVVLASQGMHPCGASENTEAGRQGKGQVQEGGALRPASWRRPPRPAGGSGPRRQ